MKPLRKLVAVSDCAVAFFVRKELDEKRVSQFIKLLQAGEDLGSITVWHNSARGRYEVIDGRHRLEAARRLENEQIEVIVRETPDFAERMIEAVRANEGGSLPPTDEDYATAIGQLFDHGVSRKRVTEEFPLPKKYTVQLIHDVLLKRARVRMNQACNAVANQNLTVAAAAVKFGVEEVALKAILSGSRRRAKVTVSDFLGGFSVRFKSLSQANAHDYRKIFDAYESGELDADNARKLLVNVARKFRASLAALNDWQARFEVMVQESEERTHQEAAESHPPVTTGETAREART